MNPDAATRLGAFVLPRGASPLMLAPETINSLVTTAEAANLAKVSAATIRSWANRGQLKAAEHRNGRPLYRWIDVAKAERLTRDLARRTFVA